MTEEWDLEAPDQRIPVTVLTGFLGSGKTTVLNHLVDKPEFAQTLVLINEFGEIGIDHDLVTHSVEDVVVEMSSGCLCCTIRSDLVRTLRDATWRYARDGKIWFDRVIIETTGLADPIPILHTLMTDDAIARQYRLDGVVTVVDVVNGLDTLDRQIESVKQAAVADRILLTKADLTDGDALAILQERLAQLNPGANRILAPRGMIEPSSVVNLGLYDPTSKSVDVHRWLNAEAHEAHHAHHHHHDVNRHGDEISAICIALEEPIEEEALNLWLDALLLFRGPDLLRVKGIVHIRGFDRPVVIHGVQHIFHPAVALDSWPSDDRRSRFVFITRGITEASLRGTLELFNRLPPKPPPKLVPLGGGGDDMVFFEVRR
jgi:G3E family GTPase